MKLYFTKMQAAGNDYVYLDCRAGRLPTRKEAAALAVRLSRRRFSVGGDGIILKGVENTIRNVGVLGRHGMKETDRTIIELMTK